jgi:hypothetical protein
VVGGGPSGLIEDVRRLVERQLPYRQAAGRRGEGERRPTGVPVQVRRPARLLEHRSDVLDLAFHGVRRGVAAVAAPASIDVEDREVGGQKLGERSVRASIHRCAGDERHRWTRTKPIEGDRGAIWRNDGVHPFVSLPSRSQPASGSLTNPVPLIILSAASVSSTSSRLLVATGWVSPLGEERQGVAVRSPIHRWSSAAGDPTGDHPRRHRHPALSRVFRSAARVVRSAAKVFRSQPDPLQHGAAY